MLSRPRVDDRWLALGLLVAVLTAVWLLFIQPAIDHRQDLEDRTATLQRALAEYRALVAQRPEVEQVLAEVRQRTSTADVYLTESEPNLAAAEVRRRLDSILMSAATGCQVMSQQDIPLTEKEAATATMVTVRLRLSCSLEGLQALLYHAETGRPLLFIGDLNVLAQGAQPFGGAARAPVLDVRFDAAGYLRRLAP